ncbi:MAG: deoxyribodipyrimidine photo-lyase [Akkermansiaceae bacterium]|nr:deoxyribodipyrimidine photo-lyase [Akkermansiaceae bacterium]
MCAELGIAFHYFKDAALHGPDEVLKSDGSPYRVYTPYSKPWLSLPPGKRSTDCSRLRRTNCRSLP